MSSVLPIEATSPNFNPDSTRHSTKHRIVTTNPLSFVTLRSPAEIVRAVEVALATFRGANLAARGDPRVLDSSPQGIVIEAGRGTGERFRTKLTLKPNSVGDTEGVYLVTDWTEANEIVLGIEQMKTLKRHVWDALETLDPTLSITAS